MKRFLFAAMIAALSLGGLAFAQEGESDVAPAKTFSLQLSGDHQFIYRLPVGEESWATGYDGEMKTPRFRSEVGAEVKEGEVTLVSRWQLDDFLNLNADPKGQWTASTRARNLENYISWNPEAFRLAFGYQVFTWGVADGRNPTDNINPRDYTSMDGNKDHKIPILSASVNWYASEKISLETVYIPQATNSISPQDYLTMLDAYGFTTSYAPADNTPGGFIGGGKVNYRSQAVDFSLSYLYDLDQLYTPVISNATTTGADIALERKRIQRFGADAKTTLGPFGLWAEACYSLTGNTDGSDYSERLPRFDYTLGFDFSYGPGDNYYLNLQYTGTIIPGFDSSRNTETTGTAAFYEKNLVASLAGEREGVLQGVTWNAHWNLMDSELVPTFTGAYSLPFDYDDSSVTRYGNLVLRPEIDIMPVDSFHITVGAILTYAWIRENGKSVTLDTTQDSLGIYTPFNHCFLSVSYKWNYELSK